MKNCKWLSQDKLRIVLEGLSGQPSCRDVPLRIHTYAIHPMITLHLWSSPT